MIIEDRRRGGWDNIYTSNLLRSVTVARSLKSIELSKAGTEGKYFFHHAKFNGYLASYTEGYLDGHAICPSSLEKKDCVTMT